MFGNTTLVKETTKLLLTVKLRGDVEYVIHGLRKALESTVLGGSCESMGAGACCKPDTIVWT